VETAKQINAIYSHLRKDINLSKQPSVKTAHRHVHHHARLHQSIPLISPRILYGRVSESCSQLYCVRQLCTIIHSQYSCSQNTGMHCLQCGTFWWQTAIALPNDSICRANTSVNPLCICCYPHRQ